MEFKKEERDSALRAVWWTLHTTAFNANTYELAEKFEDTVLRPIITNLFCEKCRYHGTKYLQEVPYSLFRSIRDPHDAHKFIGPFIYVHRFHNKVNERTGKEQIPYDTALSIFSEQKINCSGGCELNAHEIDLPNSLPELEVPKSAIYPPGQYTNLPWITDSREVITTSDGKLIYRKI